MDRMPESEEHSLELDLEPDPRESPYELPPLDGGPFEDVHERERAIRQLIEQAERERSGGR